MIRKVGITVAACLAAFAIGSAVPATQPSTSIEPYWTPDAATDIGGCVYYCGAVRYTSRSACQASCASFCEPVC